MSGKGKDLNNRIEKGENFIRAQGSTIEVRRVGLGDVERMASSQKIDVEMLTSPTTFSLDHERIQEKAMEELGITPPTEATGSLGGRGGDWDESA
jgi:hypothetical protein